jgi:hypothetical protein
MRYIKTVKYTGTEIRVVYIPLALNEYFTLFI